MSPDFGKLQLRNFPKSGDDEKQNRAGLFGSGLFGLGDRK
jgi:hypothetical protein